MSGTPLAHLVALAKLAEQSAAALEAPVKTYVTWIQETLARGGTLYFAGNGGSAAHAQHIATEYVVRYQKNRRPARAVALTTDTSLLTAAANDLGFELIFARQVEALAREGDLLVLISTSGNSPNLVLAAEAAQAAKVRTVALLGGSGGQLKGAVDLAIIVPSTDTAHIQEIQLAVDHHVCGLVESGLA
jgi:D-sedoheptulose 7-phosphate isomerase